MPIAKILLVDAAADMRRRAPDILTWAEVFAATSLAEALPLAEQERPDLVLLDAAVPDLDIAAAIEQLSRRQPEDHPIVVIMVQGTTVSEEERYRRAGADGVIAKPLDRDASERLRALFAEVRLNRQVAHLRELGGEDFVAEMIDLFLDFAPSKLDEAKRALTEGQADALRRAAHSLKAAAANLGAELVRDLAGRIESLAAENQLRTLPTLIGSLEAAFQQLRGRLQQYKAAPR